MKSLSLLLMLSCAAASAETAEERFNALPEAKKEELRERMRKFKALPPQEQERIKGNLERFKSLPPEDRDRPVGPTRG